jgi:hypothetical protein
VKHPRNRFRNKTIIHKRKPQRSILPSTTEASTFRSNGFVNPRDLSPNFYCASDDEDKYPSLHESLQNDFPLMAKPAIEPMELLDVPMKPNYVHSEATSPAISSGMLHFGQPLNNRPLSPTVREAVFNHLKDDLGPPSGFQESVGTYQAFMRQQDQWLLDQILRSPQEYKKDTTHSQIPDLEQNFPSSPESMDGVDFRRWMLFGYPESGSNGVQRSSLVPNGYPPTPNPTPQKSSHLEAPLATDCGQLVSFGTAHSDDYLQPFDHLFPEPPMQHEYYLFPEIMESPVLRSENSYMVTNGNEKTIHFDEKQNVNSSIRHPAKQLLSLPHMITEMTATSSSSYSLSSQQEQILPQFPEIEHDVFHEEPTITRGNLCIIGSKDDNSSAAGSVPRSRSRISAFSRSQTIRMMFENEQTRSKSSTLRLHRTRTSSAGGGV